MNSFEIIRLQCPSCGGSLDIDNREETKCKFCGTLSIIIPPVKSNLINLNLNDDQRNKLSNIIFLIEQSIAAGNFREAYEYCNKGLEIEATLGSLWENKAICSYWLEKTDNIINSDAREIFTYLNAAKKVDPNSATFKSIAEKIFLNLFNRLIYRINNLNNYVSLKYLNNEHGFSVYTDEAYKEAIKIMNIIELCYDIFPEIKFLEYVINEYSGNGTLQWVEQWEDGRITNIHSRNINFSASDKLKQLIEKNKKKYPNYNTPRINMKGKIIKRYNTIVLIIFLLISVGIFIYILSLKTMLTNFIGLSVIAIIFYNRWPSKVSHEIFKQQNLYYLRKGIDFYYTKK